MCACAMALGAGMKPQEIWQRISLCRLPAGRTQSFFSKKRDLRILFDAYNANPASMKAFFQQCAKTARPEKSLFVIGDMKELGKKASFYHKELSREPALLKSRWLAFIGEHAGLVERSLKQNGFQGVFVGADSYHRGILSALNKEAKSGDFVALKASRSLQLERLLFDLSGEKVFSPSSDLKF